MLTMGSLFDGIGGFPLAAVRSGITPVWASEIEAFPIEVTKYHFPNMVHVGDITRLNGANLPPVDIICGGSPCQDLSVAGARAGLTGSRSGLFMEQIRIIKEMRDEDKRHGRSGIHVQPRFAVWENVPGCLSSGRDPKTGRKRPGSDFRQVLEAFLQIEEPALHVLGPPNRRWEYSGAILGDRSSLAWVRWDAQYLGVPQRRRRIFLICDFAGQRPIQILFDQKSLPGYPAAGEGAGEGPAAAIRTGLEGAGGADSGGGAPR